MTRILARLAVIVVVDWRYGKMPPFGPGRHFYDKAFFNHVRRISRRRSGTARVGVLPAQAPCWSSFLSCSG
jgi:hypothetical protein